MDPMLLLQGCSWHLHKLTEIQLRIFLHCGVCFGLDLDWVAPCLCTELLMSVFIVHGLSSVILLKPVGSCPINFLCALGHTARADCFSFAISI